MRAQVVAGMMLAVAVLPLSAQGPSKEMTGFVVTVGESSVTLSNVPLRNLGSRPPGESGTFAMPAPKPGETPPSWVAADPKKDEGEPQTAEPRPTPGPRMVMMAPAGGATGALALTEIHMEKGAVKRADFAAGVAVKVTYREADGRKTLEKIEKIDKIERVVPGR